MLELPAEQQTLIGESPSFLEVIDQVSIAAKHGRPVLVVGERGTGKEMIASRLHFLSPRWEQSYIQVNCGALSDTLLDSELFGHEAGSFTGAIGKRIGRFEEAHNGTIFLDEIGTISMSAQEKILRITEYGSFQRLGGSKTLNIDVRLIGATNIDLPTAADLGEFRHDLLDRLAMDVVTLPPLRARQDDIMPLALHYGQRTAKERGWFSFLGFSKPVIEQMMEHEWRGNIRELKNLVERAVHYAEDEYQLIEDIVIDPFESPYRPKPLHKPVKTAPVQHEAVEQKKEGQISARIEQELHSKGFEAVVQRYEKDILKSALEHHQYNQREVAKSLQLTYHQLRHKLKKHGL